MYMMPCTEQISISDYVEQLLDDVDIDAGLIIKLEELIEQYRDRLPLICLNFARKYTFLS